MRFRSSPRPRSKKPPPKLNGGPDDQNGNASFSFGGAFLVPYPNRIIGPVSADGTTVTTKWHGKTITLPANWHSSADPTKDKHAMHGLILASQTQDVQTQSIPDGQTLTGVIHAGDFGGHWLSQTDLSFVISLTGSAVDATIVAKNVGKEDEPMAIGWHPYFAVPSGDRKQALLHVPARQVAAINNYEDVFPTGDLMSVTGTKYDFTAPRGKALDDIYLDDNWSKLRAHQRRRRRHACRSGEQLRRPHPRPLAGDPHHPGLCAAHEAVRRYRGAVQLRRPLRQRVGQHEYRHGHADAG